MPEPDGLSAPFWDGLNDPKDYWVQIVGRLKPGISRSRAEAALAQAEVQEAQHPLLHLGDAAGNHRSSSNCGRPRAPSGWSCS